MQVDDIITMAQWNNINNTVRSLAAHTKRFVPLPAVTYKYIQAEDKNAIAKAINSLEDLYSNNCCQSNCCQSCQSQCYCQIKNCDCSYNCNDDGH
jgi:hypothetical protein